MLTSAFRAWRRLLFWWRRKQLEEELSEEMALHLQLKRESAGPTCRREMGNMTLAKEESRDMWGFVSFDSWLQDIRFALRSFIRNPLFTCVAIASLALGIGANTAVFSIVNAVLIRPLPFPQPNRLLRITGLYPKAILAFFQERSRTMEIAFVSPGAEFNLTGNGRAFRLTGSETSVNFFSVMGAAITQGREFHSGEDRPGQDALVILSHELWESQFHADSSVLGRTITLAGVNRRVVGIAAAGFAFPSAKVQFWIPARMDPSKPDEYWGGEFVPLIARLRPDFNIQQASREIHSLAAGVWKMFPWPMPHGWNADSLVMTLQDDLAGGAGSKLFLLFGCVGTVLIIACANVAGLLLARATARRKEIGLRAALGAGTARIIRQLLSECMVLALSAGAVGILLGVLSTSLFQSAMPAEMLKSADLHPDWRVCVFATALSILTGAAFGMAPALATRRLDLVDSIRTGSQRSVSKNWLTLRGWLIAGEIALTVVLVAGAGLLTKSLVDLTAVNPGFQVQHILALKISPNDSNCTPRTACTAYYQRLLRTIRGMSGVADAAIVNTLPLDGELPAIAADVEDHPRTPEFPSPMLWAGAVSPGYFRLMRMPLLSGKPFSDSDAQTSAAVLVVSESTAKRFWPNGNAVGKHIRRAGESTWRTVVGVVGDVRQFDLANHSPGSISGFVYMPYAQAVVGNGQAPVVMNLVVKAMADSPSLRRELRRLIITATPDVPVGPVLGLADVVADSIAEFRSILWLFLGFAGAALVLAAIGLYGLISYSVSQRTYEISVRMAIGAKAVEIAGMILMHSLRITAAGLTAGVLLAFLVTRFLSSLLFGVSATDPLTYGAVALLVLTVAATASSLPAWRAARIDPIQTLRAE